MSDKLFTPKSRWIWLKQSTREYNTYASFRRAFTLKSLPKSATLNITADSRYEVFLNGTWLGHGPVRAFPNPWPVDTYDVAHLLRNGDNTLAVLTTHFGISSFQYIHAPAGLRAELRAGGVTVATDTSWRALEHTGYAWPAPRIACQQAWEEQFDARVYPGAPETWTAPDFDDRTWPAAAAVVTSPHTTFEPRPIPHLTRQPTAPVAVRAVEAVRPAPYTFNLYPHDVHNKSDRSANHTRGRLLLVTWIDSPKAQPIQLHQPHVRPWCDFKLNGTPLKFDDHSLQQTDTGVAHAKLKKGTNVLICALPDMHHYWWTVVNLWTTTPVTFAASPTANGQRPAAHGSWLAFGPFPVSKPHAFDTILNDPETPHPGATDAVYDAAWSRGTLSPEDLARPFARPMPPHTITTADAYATSASDRVDPTVIPNVDNPTALLHDTEDWTTIHPLATNNQQLATRLLLDFGREVIGFQEFELDAPAGVVIDNHNFEFIQRDGRHNLNEGMNNSFRYTTRAGRQTYRTFLRRGYRYAWLTFRNLRAPLRIRFFRTLLSTYPQTGVGCFECSDKLLDAIWAAGVHSVRCCSEDTYTDCPTYEQTYWVGDARNEALVDLVANGDPRLSAHCLRLAGRSLDRSPLVESQVPSGWQNLLPTWSFLWMRWADEHHQLTGDDAFAREMLTFVDRNVKGVTDHLNKHGLFQLHAWNLFDWAGMDTPAAGVVTHMNCFIVLALNQCAALATRLGDKTRPKKWTELATKIAQAVNHHLWSDAKQAYTDCIRPDGTMSPVFSQQTVTAAYISGVASAFDQSQIANGKSQMPRAARCRDILHNPPPGFVTTGSPFFMFFLLEALVREQDYSRLLTTVRDYWGAQIHAGATTFWEMFHPDKPRLTRSHCHGWSAAPTFFLTQHILGVQPLEPGYRKILIAPHPAGLKYAHGTVPTSLGPVECYWQDTPDRFTLRLTLPNDTPARVDLPYPGPLTLTEGKQKRQGGHTFVTGPIVRLTVTKTPASVATA